MLTKTFSGLSEGEMVKLGPWIILIVKINPEKRQVTVKISNLESPVAVIGEDEVTHPTIR